MPTIVKPNSYCLLGVDYNAAVKDTVLEPPVFVLCIDMKTGVQEIKFSVSAEIRIYT